MTRAETIAAIRDGFRIRNEAAAVKRHWDGCVIDWQHKDCAIAWLLEELECREAKINLLNHLLNAYRDNYMGVK